LVLIEIILGLLDTEAMFEVLPGEDMKAMPLFRPRKP
jgi:hypothetical protein